MCCDLDLTFKVDLDIISDLDLTHSMLLIIHCLVLLQKRVIRLICGAKRLDRTNLLFHNVHILKIPDLVKLKTAIIMFKAYCYLNYQ